MRDVADCIDARIGPARAGHGHGGMQQGRQGALERLLDTRGVGLDLPAAEIRTVVGEFDEIPHNRPQN